MHGPIAFPPPQAPRRLILGAAFLLALVVSLPHKTAPASAQESKAPANTPASSTQPSAEEAKRNIETIKGTELEREARKAVVGKDAGSAAESPGADSDSTHTITVKKGGKTITLT